MIRRISSLQVKLSSVAKRLAVLLGVFALAATAASAVTAPYVSGNLLKYGSGSRFIVGGTAVYIIPFYTTNHGTADPTLKTFCDNCYNSRDTIFARMAQLGWNAIRVPVSITTYNSDPYNLGGKSGFLTRLQNIVSSANAHGLYVDIGWWDSMNWGSAWPSNYTQDFQMMQDVYNSLGANPMVMYEPYNEPNNVTWAQWETVWNATVQQWRQTVGYHGVLFVDTINYSWGFLPSEATTMMNKDASYLGTSNIMFANHRYANNSTCFCGTELTDWETDNGDWGNVGSNVGTYPIVGTEYGFYDGSSFQNNPQWFTDLLTYLHGTKLAQGFNGMWDFVWSWSDGNNMTNSDMVTLNTHGLDSYNLYISPTFGALPGAPSGLTATGGNVQVALSWTGGSGATSYNVKRSTVNGSGYATIASPTTTSYTDTAVTNGTTYYYVATSVNGKGESANSNQASATPNPSAPPAPTGLSATAGNAQVALSWTASSGATSYNVKQSTVSGSGYVTVSSPTTTGYTNTGLTNGTTYYFVVSAVNAVGESANSSQVSATPSAGPAAPTNLSASSPNKPTGKIILVWTQSTSSGITANKVYRSTVAGGPYAFLISINPTTSYGNTGLTTGTTYYYRVTAVTSGGESPYSNEASATSN
jgi:fibronectin type 3 domain-containing protein